MEGAALAADPEAPIARAYLPPPPPPLANAATDASAVTGAVAAQYRSSPYPVWRRVNAATPDDALAAIVARLGPDAPVPPREAEILVAGCGTGYEAALWARRAPDARITAIDLSEASLAYAARRCAEQGIGNIRFERLDLHEISALGQQFDLITSSGVLHHLPDPERGWTALAEVLRPGGLLHLMLYCKLARFLLHQGFAAILREFTDRPVDDDLLRAARARLLQLPRPPASRDFCTLTGLRDVLFHAHEDPFDVPRIRANIERLGLRFLGFDLPTPGHRARYAADHPEDPWRRDYSAWARLELQDPRIFAGMYKFWCARPEDRAATLAPSAAVP